MIKLFEFCKKNDISLTIHYHHGEEIVFEFEKVIYDVKCGYKLRVSCADFGSLSDDIMKESGDVICNKLTKRFNLNNDPNNTKCPKCHGEGITYDVGGMYSCPLCKVREYWSYGKE